MSKLLSLSKNLVVLTGLLLLLFLTLIWFAGPRFGLEQVNYRIVTILTFVVAWTPFILIAVRKRQSSQPAGGERSTSQAPVPSAMLEQGEEVGAFRVQLGRAVQWLKESKSKKLSGRGDVVYQLPWYILIGPPASGKSMLLGQSNLDFPYTDPDRAIGRRGIEPTKSCDLWISNAALFIDAPRHSRMADV